MVGGVRTFSGAGVIVASPLVRAPRLIGPPVIAPKPRAPVIPPLNQSDLIYTPGQPEFLQLAGDTLGNVGTDKDGFDVLLSDILAAVAADDASGGIGDAELLLAAFTPGDFEAAVYRPVAEDIVAFQAAGDALISGAPAPDPTGGGGGGAPPGGTGGGGGGGGGTTLCGFPPNTIIDSPTLQEMALAITDQMGLVGDQLERLRC
jgi:hypothetical protein